MNTFYWQYYINYTLYIADSVNQQCTSFRKDYESLPSEVGNYAAIDEMRVYDRRTSKMYPSISRRRILREYESGMFFTFHILYWIILVIKAFYHKM